MREIEMQQVVECPDSDTLQDVANCWDCEHFRGEGDCDIKCAYGDKEATP
jgi:hypothetical protein